MGSGILGLIGNYVNARHRRQAEEDQENYERLMEAYAAYASPNIGNFMENAKQDVHVAIANMIGDKEYKEHQPFVERALMGIGNSAIGALAGTMPMWGHRVPRIPTAVDPQTGQPVNVGQGAPGDPNALPTLKRQPGQPKPGPGQGLEEDPATGKQIVVPYNPYNIPLPPNPLPPDQVAPATVPPGAASTAAAEQVTPSPPPGVLPTLAGTAQAELVTPPGPPTGSSTPVSKLAPPTTQGVTPSGLIGSPGKGGYYSLPQDIIDVGRANTLAQRGLFGKTPQEVQGIIRTYQMEVQAGRMTSQQAIEAIQKAIQANVDPSTRAGAEPAPREVYYEKKDGSNERPLILEEKRDGTLRGEFGGKYRSDLTHDELIQSGWTKTSKPPADIPKVVSVRADDPEFQAYMRTHYDKVDLSQFSPDQKWNIGRMNRGAGEFTGFPTLDASQAGSRNIEAQMVQAAQDSLEEYNPQTKQWGRVSPARARAFAGKMFLERQALINARTRNNLDISAYRNGMPVKSADLPGDLRISGGRPNLDLGGEPQDQGAGTQDQGAAGAATDDAAARMQGITGGGAQPTGQAPVPNQLPAGAQPPAAGSPGAPPSASTPPQAPATHQPTVPPVPQPQGGGGSLIGPTGGASSDQDYIENYLAWTKDKPMSNMASRGRTLMGQRIRQYYANQGQQLSDVQLAAVQSSAENNWQAYGAAQALNSQKQALVVPLVNTLDKFAKQWIAQARRLPDYGSRMGNSFHRDLLAQFQNNPELASYKAQGLGLGATWTTVTSNAVNSNAQLESGNLKRTTDVLSHNATFDEAAAGVSRILLEGATEKWRYQDASYEIEKQKADSLFGKLSNYGSVIGPAPAEPPNLPPPPDGYTKVYRQKGKPDQYFHYDALEGRYVPGMGRRKPFSLGRFR